MEGQIAVGNVVLNRMRHKSYPNTIYGVIFDRKHGTQFSPVSYGTIYNPPASSSVIAAKMCLEGFYAQQGLSFTDAVNIFIQQSLNMGGLPFLASYENEEYMKAKAMRRLMEELKKGWDSAERDGWVSEEDAYRQLGIEG